MAKHTTTSGGFFCPRCGSSILGRGEDESKCTRGPWLSLTEATPTYESWIIRRESWLSPPFPLARGYVRNVTPYVALRGRSLEQCKCAVIRSHQQAVVDVGRRFHSDHARTSSISASRASFVRKAATRLAARTKRP
jgi:hypothetical protein